MPSLLSRCLAPLSLWTGAAAYFLLGARVTLEWIDEGQFLYLSWRVAEGALPYRDFHHNYAPSMFFLNGALFWLFGPTVLPLRLSLVALKATMALLVYVAGKRLAGPIAGLAAYALCVAAWGVPFWFVNAPYASLYQNVLCLLGALLLVALPRHRRASALLSGVVFGIATTFKQTGGILCFAAVVLAVAALDVAADQRGRATSGWQLPRWLGVALAGAVLVVYVGYSARFGAARDTVVLAGPAALFTLWIARRLWTARLPLADARWCWLVAGFFVAPTVYATYFVAHGAARQLLSDTLIGLPQMVTWVVPLPSPQIRAVAVLAIAACVLALARAAAQVTTARWRWLTLTAVLAGLVVAAVLTGSTFGDVAPILTWLPALITWVGVAALFSDGDRDEPWLIILALSCGSLVVLQPVADVAHVMQAVPIFLPLAAASLAPLFRRAADAPADRVGVLASAGTVALLVFVLAMPLARTLARVRAANMNGVAFERTGSVRVETQQAHDTEALLSQLRARGVQQRGLLVLPSEPLLYYLAGEPSLLEGDEFAIYLGTYGLIAPSSARGLVDQAGAARTLSTRRPIIVRVGSAQLWASFAAVFPTLAREIDDHFVARDQVGMYRILEPVDGTAN